MIQNDGVGDAFISNYNNFMKYIFSIRMYQIEVAKIIGWVIFKALFFRVTAHILIIVRTFLNTIFFSSYSKKNAIKIQSFGCK